MANEEVSNIGVKLTLDASNFNAGMGSAQGKLNTLQQQAAKAASGAKASQANTGAAGGKTTASAAVGVTVTPAELQRALTAATRGIQSVHVPIDVDAKSLSAMKGKISAAIGVVPVQIAPQFSKTGPNSPQAIIGTVFSAMGGLSPQKGQTLAKQAIEQILPKRATGGPVSAGRPVIVGEHRAEVFRPGASGFIERDVAEYRKRAAELAALEYMIQQRQKNIGRMSGGYAKGGPIERRAVPRAPRMPEQYGYASRLSDWQQERERQYPLYEEPERTPTGFLSGISRRLFGRSMGGLVKPISYGAGFAHALKGARVPMLPPGTRMPPEFGTAPLREGYVRGYHRTGGGDYGEMAANLASIRQHGLRMSRAQGHLYGEPDAAWFTNTPYEEAYAVEAHLPSRWFGQGRRPSDPSTVGGPSSNMAVSRDISRRRFASYSEPWMRHTRYMQEVDRGSPGRVMRDIGSTVASMRGDPGYESMTQGYDQFVAEAWRNRHRSMGGYAKGGFVPEMSKSFLELPAPLRKEILRASSMVHERFPRIAEATTLHAGPYTAPEGMTGGASAFYSHSGQLGGWASPTTGRPAIVFNPETFNLTHFDAKGLPPSWRMDERMHPTSDWEGSARGIALHEYGHALKASMAPVGYAEIAMHERMLQQPPFTDYPSRRTKTVFDYLQRRAIRPAAVDAREAIFTGGMEENFAELFAGTMSGRRPKWTYDPQTRGQRYNPGSWLPHGLPEDMLPKIFPPGWKGQMGQWGNVGVLESKKFLMSGMSQLLDHVAPHLRHMGGMVAHRGYGGEATSLYGGDPEALEAAAIKHFGVTDDIREAGYLTPSGKFLDFSGRHDSEGYKRQGDRWVRTSGHYGADDPMYGHLAGKDYLAGQRGVDHNEANQILPGVPQGEASDRMKSMGFIRVWGTSSNGPQRNLLPVASIGAEMSRVPTMAQISRLVSAGREAEHVSVDAMDPMGYRLPGGSFRTEYPDDPVGGKRMGSFIRQATEIIQQHDAKAEELREMMSLGAGFNPNLHRSMGGYAHAAKGLAFHEGEFRRYSDMAAARPLSRFGGNMWYQGRRRSMLEEANQRGWLDRSSFGSFRRSAERVLAVPGLASPGIADEMAVGWSRAIMDAVTQSGPAGRGQEDAFVRALQKTVPGLGVGYGYGNFAKAAAVASGNIWPPPFGRSPKVEPFYRGIRGQERVLVADSHHLMAGGFDPNGPASKVNPITRGGVMVGTKPTAERAMMLEASTNVQGEYASIWPTMRRWQAGIWGEHFPFGGKPQPIQNAYTNLIVPKGMRGDLPPGSSMTPSGLFIPPPKAMGGLVQSRGAFASQIFDTASEWASDPFMAMMAYQQQQQKQHRARGGRAWREWPRPQRTTLGTPGDWMRSMPEWYQERYSGRGPREDYVGRKRLARDFAGPPMAMPSGMGGPQDWLDMMAGEYGWGATGPYQSHITDEQWRGPEAGKPRVALPGMQDEPELSNILRSMALARHQGKTIKGHAAGGPTERGLYIVNEQGDGSEGFVAQKDAHLIPKFVMDRIPHAKDGAKTGMINKPANSFFAPQQDGIIIPKWAVPYVGALRHAAGGFTNVEGVAVPPGTDAETVRMLGVYKASGSTAEQLASEHGWKTWAQYSAEMARGVEKAGPTRARELPQLDRPNLARNLAEGRAGIGKELPSRTPQGAVASIASFLFGGVKELGQAQVRRAQAEQDYSKALRVTTGQIQSYKGTLAEYRTSIAAVGKTTDEGIALDQARTAYIARVKPTIQRSIALEKERGEALEKADAKAKPTSAGIIKNIGVIIGATTAYGLAMQAAGAVLQPAIEGSVKATQNWANEAMGFATTSQQVTKTIGDSARQMGGNVQAAISQAAGQGGLGTAGTALAQQYLTSSVLAKAGGAAAQQGSDTRRAIMGSISGAREGLYGGYGGLGGGAFLAEQLGGAKGTVEILTKDLATLTGAAAKPGEVPVSGRQGAVTGPGPVTGQRPVTGQMFDPSNPSGNTALPPGPHADEYNALLESTVKDYNEASKRYTSSLGIADNGLHLLHTEQSKRTVAEQKQLDSMKDAAEANRGLGGAYADYADRVDELYRSSTVLLDAQGNVVKSMKEATSYWDAVSGGALIQTDKQYADQQARALKASQQVTAIMSNFEIGTSIPGQMGLQLAAQPFAPAAAGILPTGNAAAAAAISGMSAGGINVGETLASAQKAQDELTAAGKKALNSYVDWASNQPGMNEPINLPTGESFNNSGDALKTFVGQITDAGSAIEGWQTKIAGAQSAMQWAQYNNNLRLANRAYADARALAGQGGGGRGSVGELGGIERQQTLLGFGMQQKTINFQTAMAGFQAPGLTSEERAARQQQAKAEAAYAQKQLNLSERGFQVGAGRGVVDTKASVSLLKQEYATQNAIAAAQRQIATEELKLSQAQQKAQSVLGKAQNNFQGAVQSAAGYVAQFGGSVQSATKTIYEALGYTVSYDKKGVMHLSGGGVPNQSGSPDDRNHAAGYLGRFARGATMTVGEAGPEEVAILRNPRAMMMGGGFGGGGGGPVTVNLNLTVQGDVSGDATVAKIVRAVEDAFNRKAARLGMRSYVSAAG